MWAADSGSDCGLMDNVSMKWRVVLEEDTETHEWAIWCPELPGCTSAGFTRDEALANIREAILLYLTPDDLELDPGAEILEIAV